MHFIGKFLILVIACLITNVICERGGYFGCYEKNFNSQYFTFDGDVNSCIDQCERNYFRYAVLGDEKCSCFNVIKSHEEDAEKCNKNCTKNPQQMCGGLNTESYYLTDLRLPGPVTNFRLGGAATNTSIVLRWDPPETINLVTSYVITANVLQTSSSYMVGSPTWTFQNTSTNAKLVNLHPDTKYNITIQSESQYGEGGTQSVVVATKIGIPDPEPYEPKIIEQTDQTMTIEIQPAINNNGPITWYRVLVHFTDQNVLQTFNESLFTDYKSAQEDGIPYYIAAEIPPKSEAQRFVVGDEHTYRGYVNPPLPKNRHTHISLGVVSEKDGEQIVRYGLASHDQHKHVFSFGKKINHDHDGEDNSTLVTVLTIACILFGIVLVGTVIAYFYLRKKLGAQGRARRRLSENHEMNLHGPIVELENNGYVYDPEEGVVLGGVNGSTAANGKAATAASNLIIGGNFKQNLNKLLSRLNVDQKLPRNALTLDIDHIIGAGEFGDVIRGSLHRNNISYSCQVHVISDDMEKETETIFLREVDSLMTLTPHRNILDFYGVCTTSDWMYVVIEDVPYSLKRHLLVSRDTAQPGRLSFISEDNIIKIMWEIADVMEYLSSRKFIHKRLCTHNIRLTSKHEIKLSIFGPTLYDDQGKLIDLSRWHSPETLKFQNHSTASDVWSMGCLMWECCCLGATLYPNIPASDLLPRIKNGARPEQPTFIFDDLYQLFLNCWEMDPSDRPSFTEIKTILSQLLTASKHAISYDCRENGAAVIFPYHLPLLENKI